MFLRAPPTVNADLIDEDFTVDPGWTVTGTAVVSGGEAVATVVSGGSDHLNKTVAAQTEVWASFDFSIDSGLSLGGGKKIRCSGIHQNLGIRLLIGVANSGGLYLSTYHDADGAGSNGIQTVSSIELTADQNLYYHNALESV